MKDVKFIASIIGGALIFLFGISLFFSKSSSSNGLVDQQFLVLGASNVCGLEDAVVTVVEFADFQSSACQAAHSVVESLLADFGDRIRFVYRHFPLTAVHQHALSAANAAEAAGEEGKFWEYSQVLFDQRDVWSQVKDPTDLFISYARQVDLENLDQFQGAVEKEEYQERVLADLQLGNKSGLNGLPTFFVNGEKTDVSGLRLAVEKILSKGTD